MKLPRSMPVRWILVAICLWVVLGAAYFSWRPVRRMVDRELGLEHTGDVTVTDGDVSFQAEYAIEQQLCGLFSHKPGRCRATNVRKLESARVEVTGNALDCRKGGDTVVAWTVIYAVTDGRSFRPSLVRVGDEILLFDP